MYVMNEQEKKAREEIKALYARVRTDMHKAAKGELKLHRREQLGPSKYEARPSHREMLLIWGFLRGFKFRRIERSHRMQDGKEILSMYANWLDGIWGHYFPDTNRDGQIARFQEWLDDPEGAIAAPPPRPKRPYIAPEAAAAEE